ncbi:CPBP family intramembrane glutamic endopeptidase [Nonomuraea sp. bgisy101]|uniref:CPBP family intramembrane glutamic endopeptidase n=1 Tax=Nonomuraea sp. bgisy101 TaxID=3413784 RepID=UPI003D75B0EE
MTLAAPHPPSRARALLTRHPLIAFFGLCFVPVWAYELVGILVFDLPVAPWMFVTPFLGPTLAAVLVTWAGRGRAGVRALFGEVVRWRVPGRWYLAVCLGLPVILMACVLPLPGAWQHAGPVGSEVLPWLLGFGIVLVLGGPLGEEPGWRCFAHQHLQQRFGPVRGALLLGLLWGLWHAPLSLIEGYNHAGADLIGMAVPFAAFLIFTIAISIPLAWLANHTRSGVLAILAHTFLNASLLPVFFPGVDNSLSYLVVQDVVFGALAVALIVTTRGRLGRPE